MLHTYLLGSKQFVRTYERHLGISIHIKINVRTLMYVLVFVMERKACSHIKAAVKPGFAVG